MGMGQAGQGGGGVAVGDAVEVQVELVKKDYLVMPPPLKPRTLNLKSETSILKPQVPYPRTPKLATRLI